MKLLLSKDNVKHTLNFLNLITIFHFAGGASCEAMRKPIYCYTGQLNINLGVQIPGLPLSH